MKIHFLGTGSAFTMKNYQTNIIIEENGKRLLLDAGGDIRFSLANAGLSYLDIDALYLTHAHADHIGGVEYLAFCSYFDPRMKKKIDLFGNNYLIRDIWEHSLKGGLKSIQGKITDLNDFFTVQGVKENSGFVWEGLSIRIVQSVHVMDGYSIVSSFGLMITDNDRKKLFFTGDTQFNPNQIIDFYKQADVIIQDCETAPYPSRVHAHFNELKTLPLEIKKKMILVHFNDNVLDDEGNISKEWVSNVCSEGFVMLANKNKKVEMSDLCSLIGN